MSTGKGSRVLAIGIDAAEATLVKQLIEQKEMPALASLLDDGQWLRVESPAHIGSGAVWPTFMTGEDPGIHGVYSEWSWRPETMSLSRYHGRHLTAFWEPLARQNVSIGIFDVPFALPVGLKAGFEVCEWWAHDTTGAGLQSGPAEILSLVEQSPRHPLSANRFADTTPDSKSDLKELTAACVEGVHRRGTLAQNLIRATAPQLSLLVFPEIHHASHQMWHTVDPEHKIYERQGLNNRSSEPLLKEVYRAVDQELAGLVDLAGKEARIFVFALHGMRPALGFPAFLGAVLCERGFSRLASWSSQLWRERALSLFGAAKRHTPEAVKKLYYKLTPTVTTHKLARSTMLPSFDWEYTRAFSLPTDQYGWIRINLVGREALGSVPQDQYEKTCREVEQMLLALTTESGQPLVADITRTALNVQSALGSPLPDLVVHWRDAGFILPLKIKDSRVLVEFVGRKLTGQHASEGFCIYRGDLDLGTDGVVAAKDLGRLMIRRL
jgi:predicted AlkP superfamily phosphohydrolase/phosphomutase